MEGEKIKIIALILMRMAANFLGHLSGAKIVTGGLVFNTHQQAANLAKRVYMSDGLGVTRIAGIRLLLGMRFVLLLLFMMKVLFLMVMIFVGSMKLPDN
ncbi:hypothetical protein CKO13_08915 [Halorhodospira neutriphila]|uniref:Uncharacterized protein n=1 Tax=Halorhodospira neutriphila TaxID=168379 RepID=A0ABS1E7J3_9GAMM|nr:hypothetical protein [Halorhodospira neutriphila]